MKFLVILACFIALTSGCALIKKTKGSSSNKPESTKQVSTNKSIPLNTNIQNQATLNITNNGKILTLTSVPEGKIVTVNSNLKFVVINFGFSVIPPADTKLGVYRNGLKIGEVKLTNYLLENNAVADITSGEAEKGDIVKMD
jgi:hypothetical protein